MPMVDIDWLKDHVEVPEGLTYEQLAKDLVKVGLEEEEIHTSQLVGPIVVGYVVDATPNRRRTARSSTGATWTSVTNTTRPTRDGNKVPRGIICGAPNMSCRRKGRRHASWRCAARRLQDRTAQDLRPHLQRHVRFRTRAWSG